ncbi:TPA: hypothetical protein ACHSYA_004132 [Clostridioides difficile]|uniref:hypothetical protein n=1 Tax=Clostridioides difficile TaxID=1496 RepID=UPI001C1AD358|nr:hypothetical protein [Clostridioides difficile]
MTVFFSFLEKSATKHQTAYRYGARKEISTFFEEWLLFMALLYRYEMKGEKIELFFDLG